MGYVSRVVIRELEKLKAKGNVTVEFPSKALGNLGVNMLFQ
jgi:hypothetical protein